MTKLHLGCGPIYLVDGYTNIDLDLPHHHLASDRPDLVFLNATTSDNYYKQDINRDIIESRVLNQKEVVCDLFADITDLPYFDDSVDEIRLVQVFEHFSYPEGEALLSIWFDILKSGGMLHIDIPDLDETIRLYANADDEPDRLWARRLLFGSQKNEWGIHKAMYNKKQIEVLLTDCGYTDITFLPNIHFYPAFAVEAIKP